jgi:hypothetical protein
LAAYEPEIEDEDEDEDEEGEEETAATERTGLLLKAHDHPSYGSASARHANQTTGGSLPAAASPSPSPPPDLEARGGMLQSRASNDSSSSAISNSSTSSAHALVPAEGSAKVSAAVPVRTSSPDDADDSVPPRGWLCFAENPLSGIGDAFAILPRPLKFIWLLQLVWWYCALHVNLWWTSWVVVELYGSVQQNVAQQTSLCLSLTGFCAFCLTHHCCSSSVIIVCVLFVVFHPAAASLPRLLPPTTRSTIPPSPVIR